MGISHRKDNIAAQIRRAERDHDAMEDATYYCNYCRRCGTPKANATLAQS